MRSQPVRIAILGGGVIGVTTGIVLNLHGFRTKIYTKHLVDSIHPFRAEDRPAELASLHAAASIIPHTVDHPKKADILSISQQFFHRLAFAANSGVRVQRHYELFEHPTDVPEYAKRIEDFTQLPKDGGGHTLDENIPMRQGADGIWGWFFNIFFAETPTYMQRLYQLYRASGGTIIHESIKDADDFLSRDADAYINCAGRWAAELFPEDKKHTSVIRGHMVKVRIYTVPHDKRNQYFSYNYTPDVSVYHRKTAAGETVPADVLFYPRSDGWLLGASRQEGYPDVGAAWRNEDEHSAVDTFQKDGWHVPIPKPMWDLNRELLHDITGIDIADPKYSSDSYIGYRFARSPIRIEKDTKRRKKLLLHNYGHGGAGYTLSWGSAYEMLNILQQETNTSPHFIGREINRNVDLMLLSIIEDLMKELSHT